LNGARQAALALAAMGLVACGQKPTDAIKPLRPGLWRVATTVDHRRAGVDARPGRPVISMVCAAADPRPAGVSLAIHLGCPGQIELDPKDGVWNFAETCAATPNKVTEGMVWGNFQRAYLIERYITTTDAADPAKKTVVHESVSAKWVRSTCGTAAKGK